ncbi:hypothetical protein HYQ46_009399 [Verticillium longisporum]|nr:hypothetical protein HYQ46_009399 [Verticillium longisporum]
MSTSHFSRHLPVQSNPRPFRCHEPKHRLAHQTHVIVPYLGIRHADTLSRRDTKPSMRLLGEHNCRLGR